MGKLVINNLLSSKILSVFRHLRILMVVLLLSASHFLCAQQFPVQVNTLISPPYSVYLADYAAPSSNALSVSLSLRDLNRNQYQVKLRVTIEGSNGVKIRTVSGYTPPPIILSGGIPEVLTGFDIRNYLNPNNLEFSGISRAEFIRTGKLPEGFYTFNIEVLDYNRNVIVSNIGLANAWIVLNDPPIVNLPFNGEKVRATDPQNVMFSWTPRHTASPNAAFNTEYEFKLVEIYPQGRNPNDAILASNSIYKTTTSATSLNYSITEPLLIPGREYAFRIRAYDLGGKDLFKNNGYSEVYTFKFGDACLMPDNVTADAIDPDRIKIEWEPKEIHTEFNVQYRRKNDNTWYEEKTFSNSMIIPGLAGNTQYEYQVKGYCGTIDGEYSPVNTVQTPETEQNEFVCGSDIPNIDLSREPLQVPLIPTMTIETADFRVSIKEVTQNPDGSYSGKGWAMIPWFELATVRVKFDNIKVNENYRVYEGNMVTVYSQNSRFVADLGDDDQLDEGTTGSDEDGDDEVSDPVDDFFDNYEFEDTIQVDYDITDVEINEDGDIVITYEDENGDTQEEVVPLEEGSGDILVTDSSGDSWAIDENGGVGTSPDNTPDPLEDASQADYIVQFKANPNQSYGFDEKTYNAGQYDQIQVKGEDYAVSWKSIETGRNDYVNAVTDEDNFPLAVGFKSIDGNAATTPASIASQKQVSVTGKEPGHKEEIDAYVTVGSGDDAEEILLGRVNVKTYSKISERVVIVPVNNAQPPGDVALADALNDIYKQAVAEWRVTITEPWSVDQSMITGLTDGVSGMLSSFPYKMREFNQAFRDEVPGFDDNAYYLFLVTGAQANKSGFMPFKRQFGYIFTDELGSSSIENIIAHELGHGAFRLRHTFSPEAFKAQEGSTDNLMDYSNGTELKKYQWDLIHDPESMNGWMEDDEESAFGAYQFLAGRNVVPGLFSSYVGSASVYTFVTAAGKVLTLKNDVQDVTFDEDGLLMAFTVPENGNTERYISTRYTSNQNFAGFRKNLNGSETSSNDNIYKDYESKNLNGNVKVYIGILDNAEGESANCGMQLFESTYPVEVSGNWNSGGNQEPKSDLSGISAKLSVTNGESVNPKYGSKIKFIKKVDSPEACDLCSAGRKFVDNFSTYISTETEYQALFNTAKALCAFPDQDIINAFAAQNDSQFKEKLSEWLLWGSEAARLKQLRESFWQRPDAWQIYFGKLNIFLATYQNFKAQIAEGKLTNNNLKAIVNAKTVEFLDLYSIDERIKIITNLLPEDKEMLTASGHFNFANYYVSDSEEHAILRVLKSVNSSDDADKMLTAIAEGDFITDLNFHIDDIGFGGNNYSELAKEFQRLTLLRNNIEAGREKQFVNAHPDTYFLIWNDDNLFFPKNEDGIIVYDEISVEGESLTIRYRITENCREEERVSYIQGEPHYSTITVCDRIEQNPISINYFDPVVITISGDFSEQLDNAMIENAASGIVTYAGFLDYLNEKQGTSQAITIADYTVTGISLAFGVGELVLAIRAGATAGRIAIISFEVGTELVDAWMKTDAFNDWCSANPTDCNKVRTGNLVIQLATLGASGYDIVKNWDALKAAKATGVGVASIDASKLADDVIALGDDLGTIKNWVNKNDEFIDVIIHNRNGDNFTVLLEGEEIAVTSAQLANRIQGADASKTIRLLSCNDSESALELSQILGRDVVGSVGEMKIYDNGFIETGSWYRAKGDGILDEYPDIPTNDPNISASSDFVVLGNARKLSDKLPQNIIDELQSLLGAKYNDFISSLDRVPSSWTIKKSGNTLQLVDSKGTKWADIYNDRVVAVGGNGNGGGWNKFINVDPPLIKNHRYVVDDNFIYDTDNLGRVKKITIEDVQINPRNRNETYQQRAKTVKNGKANDDGGHMARAQWNGPSEQINYFPQDAVQNRSGEWYQMEEYVTELRQANPGITIKVEIYPVFTGNSKRPSSFEVDVTMNNNVDEFSIPNP